jgi:hypothetical protein
MVNVTIYSIHGSYGNTKLVTGLSLDAAILGNPENMPGMAIKTFRTGRQSI